MVAKRRGKRKNPSKDLVFEVSDSDVSSDNSDNESNEPHRKVLKTNSQFVESVVTALSNLQNEERIETLASRSKTDNEETIQLDESIVEIADKSLEVDNKIEEQAASAKEEIIFLDESSDGSVHKSSENVDSIIFIGEDTLYEYKANTDQSTNESSQDLNSSVIILEENCSNGFSNCNKDTELNLGTSSIKAPFETSVATDLEEGELSADDNVDARVPDIYITFSSESISNLYRSKFLDLINTCTNLRVVEQDDLTITILKDVDEIPQTPEESKKDETYIQPPCQVTSDGQTPKKKKKRKRVKKEKELFTLDTKPSEDVNPVVAHYSSKFQISENSGEEVNVSSSQSCLNCDQNHLLKDCPLPRNYIKINQMRQQYKMIREKNSLRYHIEEDQKYDHLKPGKISTKLREALGLKSNQIPSYIYQMRILGYPPGWLEEAKLFYSNLALFDSDGKHVLSENVKKNPGLDPNKIIEYPGFNAPMDKYSRDEYRLYRVPSYSSQYSKESMIEYFEKEYSKQQDDFQTLDMDLDVIDDNDYKEKPCSIPTCLPRDLEKDVQSPSMLDLETQKQSLLAALDDSSGSLLKSEDCSEKEPPQPGLEEENLKHDPEQNTVVEQSKTECSALSSESTSNKILNSDYGTPILKSCSRFLTLPNPDNFTKDVSPVINFENLPNSTGKYQQMSGLLQKVRTTLKSIQKNNS
ncbi:zinc finger CCHC domain-containing protein 8 homolog [Diorhabda carinulata]|uniref:zinc finger CCHC domain-containing protein 8 homolog n=1 Tax=Diorhabda carinulata TaxID=1163345 RepID=UPI0025A23435|nr:zinc finger CCHC domain-containing protein 8 homolog [Diorhabda carinulata]